MTIIIKNHSSLLMKKGLEEKTNERKGRGVDRVSDARFIRT